MTALWNTALSRLSTKVAPQNYEMWLRPIECQRIDGKTIHLRAPNQYVRLWFESNYLPILLDDLRREENVEFRVEFEIADPPTALSAPTEPEPEPPQAAAPVAPTVVTASGPLTAGDGAPVSGLNSKYVFETFVAGPSVQWPAVRTTVGAMSVPEQRKRPSAVVKRTSPTLV